MTVKTRTGVRALTCALLATMAACGPGSSMTGDGGGDATRDGGGGGDTMVTPEASADATPDESPSEASVNEAGGDDAPVEAGGFDANETGDSSDGGGGGGDASETSATDAADVIDVVDVVDGGGSAPDASDGGGGTGEEAGADGATACAEGQTRCGERCVPLASDNFNCGMCGRACSAGQSCVMGACACPMGSEVCSGTCTATQSDRANCGMCGRACTGAQVCSAGACGCPAGTLACGDRCVQASSDEMNCGMCGRSCGTGQRCEAGACVCPMGQTSCGMGASTTCVNTQSDAANCGACGTTCGAGQSCVMGACVCPMGQTSCGMGASATCVNAQSDNDNCGRCGNACTGGSSCVMGACVCPMGQTSCGAGAAAACTDVQTDRANCGTCGTACPAGQLCNGGMCTLTCTAPRVACGSGSSMSCANVQTDDQNCGACGTVCGTVPNSNGGLCTGGGCRPICDSGFANCDGMYPNGCEVNTNTNVSHCGACGNLCPSSAPNASSVTCTGGACRAVCEADTATLRPRDCNSAAADGCEINVLNDPNNCGTCGTQCPAGVMCVGGLCTPHSCNELHTAAPTLPSGEYDIDPDGPGGDAPMRVYCDMTTDGGGWTLVAYSTLESAGYSYCSRNSKRNFYSLARGGGTYNGTSRVDSASLRAVSLARISTEILFGRANTASYSGDIAGMNNASKFNLPSPATTNFGNASRFAPASENVGMCVPVQVTVVVGAAVSNRMRYTFSNAIGTGWGDAYPVGYGATNHSNCGSIGEGIGPMFANEYSGSFNTSYAPNGYCGSTGPNLEQGTYYHHGWWDADAQQRIGTASIWLR